MKKKIISVIGGGIAGCFTALQLASLNYEVNIIDPNINVQTRNNQHINATTASLGVMMGNIFRRSKGRSWQLRKRSMELWPQWLSILNSDNQNLIINTPLIQLSRKLEEYERMITLQKEKHILEIHLLDDSTVNYWSNIFNTQIIGGIISYQDGRIDPILLLDAIKKRLDLLGVNKIQESVLSIYKNSKNALNPWAITLNNQNIIEQEYIVICSSLESQKLLKNVGYGMNLDPILGQIIEIDVTQDMGQLKTWPAVLNFEGINFIRSNDSQLIMGATLEPGINPDIKQKINLHKMNGLAPEWIQKATIKDEWHGIRARPHGEASPILKELEKGLLVNTGHYRNGILIAPACAEWIATQIT